MEGCQVRNVVAACCCLLISCVWRISGMLCPKTWSTCEQSANCFASLGHRWARLRFAPLDAHADPRRVQDSSARIPRPSGKHTAKVVHCLGGCSAWGWFSADTLPLGLQEELSPWTAAFTAQHGRKPRLSDVERTGIEWLVGRYKAYVLTRERLLTDTLFLRTCV